MKEMTALEYFHEKARMTDIYDCGDCAIPCEECLLGPENNGKGLSCYDFENYYPQRAISIMQEWSSRHPRKTMISDFLEKNPNIQLSDEGFPIGICPYMVGYEEKKCDDAPRVSCAACWNREMLA